MNRLYRNLLILFIEKCQSQTYIYLYQNSERLLQNIKKRGRSYEQKSQGIIWTKSIAAI
jgi:deoxyadenosine/deoxycytidine kinase